LTRAFSTSGRSDPGWGTVPTAGQTLSGSLDGFGYKLAKAANVKEDYYAVYGHMSHGILHSDGAYDPEPNWVSVGYYAMYMSLLLELTTDGATVYDYGPISTVGSDSTSFSIGANLSGTVGDFNTISGGGSVGFGASFASPNTVISAARVEHAVRWDVRLPYVGYLQPAIPANPLPPSCAGYEWYFGLIVEVAGGTVPTLRVHPRVTWEYDWPRGTANDTKTWEDDFQYPLNV
jgi:hypothetical protein